jgi:hypothetical protein
MARKDEIFKNFMSHEILTQKYQLTDDDLPTSVAEGLQSEVPIIKSIALIVQNLEVPNSINDNSLRNVVTTYLNSAI